MIVLLCQSAVTEHCDYDWEKKVSEISSLEPVMIQSTVHTFIMSVKVRADIGGYVQCLKIWLT